MEDVIKVHAALARGLVDSGIHTMFGLLGDANLFLGDSYVREHGGRLISAAHEVGALLMAYGYATATGELGVATVTQGPGLANTVPGLIEGVKARRPILLISGDTRTEDQHGPQVIPQRDLVIGTGAGFELVRTPHTAVADLAQAIRRALVERRPVVLNVPSEFMDVEVEYEFVDRRPVATPPPVLDTDRIDRALGVILSSRRPVVLAGRGAIAARDTVLELARLIGAPVATTLGAKDLFRGEGLDLGLFGTLASPTALETLYKSDCVIAFGAGLNRFTTALSSLTAGRAVIHCDIDPAQLGHFTDAAVKMVGDTELVARAIIDLLSEAGSRTVPTGFWSDSRGSGEAVADLPCAPGTVGVRLALRTLGEAMPLDRTYVTDAGRYVTAAWTEVHVEGPGAFVFGVNFGAIGAGMPIAVGASYGRPEHPVLLVCGDGGFMLGGLAEFNSAVRHAVDLVVIVCNDSAYGAEYVQLANRGIPTDLVEFVWPDFATLADALGGEGLTVRSTTELQAAAAHIARRTRPLLIDVHLDPRAMPDVQH